LTLGTMKGLLGLPSGLDEVDTITMQS